MKKLTVKKGTQCMACLECVRACSEAFYKEFDPSKACLQIIDRNGAAKPMVCVQCGKCAEACEHGAITQNAKGVYTINKKLCVGCGKCAKICAHSAPIITDKKCRIDHDKCVGCGRCIAVCPKDAITPDYDQAVEVLNYKIAEYAKAVVDGRPSFHISIARDISPDCDCHEENDVPMVPDVGMFASFDPVALDLACIEAVNRQPILP